MDAVGVVPLKRKANANVGGDSQDAIRCICGFDSDDGFSIACDQCSRWCHAACFRIVDGDVPEEWKCWLCQPRPVDRDYAERLQRARFARQRDDQRPPIVDRRHRRPSAIAEAQNNPKRRRRPSIIHDDDHLDIDEPSTHAFVPISHDIVHPDARAKLIRHAHRWRGVTALSCLSESPTVPVRLPPGQLPSPTALKQLPPTTLTDSALSLFTNPDVRPPAYALHTATPVPSERFIAPFTSSITPTSSYLADPLNAYAHLGMPKPFVHLIGPPLDVALDARIAGDNARFLRSGCRPNAVLRPVLCPRDSDETLSFGVFALRDLKQNEEVILGWEWDDGNAVHALPALIRAPHTFPHPPSPSNSPHQIQYLRNQMSNIVHALSSTFTTCACGSKAKDCAVNAMAAFVDGDLSPDNLDFGPLIGNSRGFRTREKVPLSSGMTGVEMCPDSMDIDPLPHFVVNPPSPSPKRAKEKARANGLIEDDANAQPPLPKEHILPRAQLYSSVRNPTAATDPIHIPPTPTFQADNCPLPEPDPPDDDLSITEDRMPPKMRKRWKQQVKGQRRSSGASHCTPSPAVSTVSLGSIDPGTEVGIGLGIRIGGPPGSSTQVQVNVGDMPPPPLPTASHDLSHLASFEGTSPSTDFARLSLISPRADLSHSSPFQSWAPFERKEAPDADIQSSNKMEVDTAPVHSNSPPSPQSDAHSPPASDSPRSPHSPRSLHSPRPHPSPSSTAVTTPPSPREPKLPDVLPQPPIADSPESPPAVQVDPASPVSPARSMSPHDDDTIKVDRESTPSILPSPTEPRQEEDEHAPETDSTSLQPPPPPSQPKVKLSLKDFAARKKRLREEVSVRSADASPMVETTSLQSSPKIPVSVPLPALVKAPIVPPPSEVDQEKKPLAVPTLVVDAKSLPRFVPPSYSLPVKLRSEMRSADRLRKDVVEVDEKDHEEREKEEREREEREERERKEREERENEEKEKAEQERREKQEQEQREKEKERRVNEERERLRRQREEREREAALKKAQSAIFQAKQELVEPPLQLLNGPASFPERRSQPPTPLTPPLSDLSAHSRVSSQEDGEITSLPSAPIPRAPRAMVREPPSFVRRPVVNAPTGPRLLLLAQERYPPTGPSFFSASNPTQQSTAPNRRTPQLSQPPPPPVTSTPPASAPPASLPSSSTPPYGRPTPQAPRALSQRPPGEGMRNGLHPNLIPSSTLVPSSSSSSSSSPAGGSSGGDSSSTQTNRSSAGPSMPGLGLGGPAGLPVRPAVALGMGNMVMNMNMDPSIPKRPSMSRGRYNNPPRDMDGVGRERERERESWEREREYGGRVWPQRQLPQRTRESAPWGR